MEALELSLTQVNAIAQSIPLNLAPVMRAISLLGVETFYFILIPILFWFVNRSVALRTLMILLTSVYVNCVSKWIFHRPRPYWISPNVQQLANEDTFGIPSGHAQNAVAVWLMVAIGLAGIWTMRKKQFLTAAIILVALISFSRIYLGVHFIQDIIGGWLLGAIVLFSFLKFEPGVISNAFKNDRLNVLLYALPFALFGIGMGIRALVFQADSANSFAPDPWAPGSLVASCATLLGVLIATNLAPSSSNLALSSKIIWFVISLLAISALQFSGSLLPREGIDGQVYRFARYALVAFVGFGLMPYLAERYAAKKLLSANP